MNPDTGDLVSQLEKIENGADLEKWKQSHDLSGDLVRSLMTRVQDLLTVDPKAALRLSEWMIAVAIELNDPAMKALALRSKGNALVSVDDYFQSIEYFEEALKIFTGLGDELEIAGTMMNRVVVYYRLSRFEEALADADRVLEMFKRSG